MYRVTNLTDTEIRKISDLIRMVTLVNGGHFSTMYNHTSNEYNLSIDAERLYSLCDIDIVDNVEYKKRIREECYEQSGYNSIDLPV